MLKAKHDVWLKNGKEQFVVIPIEEYKMMCERLEDDADFRAIEASKKRQAKSPRTSLEQVNRELGLSRNRKQAAAIERYTSVQNPVDAATLKRIKRKVREKESGTG